MKHHPESALLEQYAAGTLPVSVALCVATHLSFCGECRRQVDSLQSLGGLLVEQLTPVALAENALAQIMARLDQPVANADADAEDSVAPIDAADADAVPRPLRRFIPAGYQGLTWSRLLPKMRAAALASGDQYNVSLQRVAAGGKVPRHDHRGEEFTVVLRGSFSDEFGVYGDGDFILREPGQCHLPRAAQNEECICLTAQQAPARFTGWFWRCLNPFLR